MEIRQKTAEMMPIDYYYNNIITGKIYFNTVTDAFMDQSIHLGCC